MKTAETLMEYASIVAAPDGARYRARACARSMEDGRWEAWLEFHPEAPGEVLRTPRESVQPNRVDTLYWCRGLTPIYLEGALARALGGPAQIRHRAVRPPAFDGPAPTYVATPGEAEPILDPFHAYLEAGAAGLRRRLSAFEAWHLRNIARACRMATPKQLDGLSHPALTELIIDTAQRRTSKPARAERGA